MARADAPLLRGALADLVLGDDEHAADAARRLEERGLWDVAIALSGPWRVTLILQQRLKELAAIVPDAARERLRAMALAASAHNAMVLARSQKVLPLFERAGIRAVAIKGIAQIAALYCDRPVRMVGDLDAIVQPENARRALAVLEAAGYVDDGPPLEQQLVAIDASPRVHNYERTLRHDGFEVDLHWQLGPRPPDRLRAERIVAGAVPARLGRTPILVAAPVDALLLGVYHALRGYLSPHETLKDVADVAAWWVAGDRWASDELVAGALDAQLAPALLALLAVLLQRNPAHPAAAGAAALARRLAARERRESAALARFFEDQLVRGQRSERTVQLFAPASLVRALRTAVRRTNGEHTRSGLASAALQAGRIVRELSALRAYGTYRALARAQARLRQN